MPVIGTSAFSTAGDATSLARSLLNDADIPSILPITPAGAVRAGNVVTITTQFAHGLQQGSIVQVGQVTDASFNGSQVVTSVPFPNQFTYNQTGPNAASGNGTVSILIQGDWATDAVLLPFVNKAYRKVQQRLLENGSPSASDEVELLAMPIGFTSLTDSTNPQLPVNFLAPRELKEKVSTTQFYGRPMKRIDQLPSGPQGTVNFWFSWRADGLFFVGATSALDMLIRYFISQPTLSDTSSVLLIRGCLDAVVSQAAFLAANSRGSANAGIFASLYQEDMKNFLNMQAHSRQYLPSRRIAYGGRRTGRGFAW